MTERAGDAIDVHLPDEAATVRLGADLALALRAGDLVALKGDLGAGKTTLARGLIRTAAGDPGLDVPSPTFTLVQAYAARVPILHADLYRVVDPDEVDELGLDEALADGIVLVEWPERAGDRFAADIIRVDLRDGASGRDVAISGPENALDRIRRSLAIRDFLDRSGWDGASRAFLTGDASARSYEVVALPGRDPHILMNSPPLALGPVIRDGKAYAEIARLARSVHAFVGMDRILSEAGISVPAIEASDLDRGLLLISHLGSDPFLDLDGRPVAERYAAAADLLAAMHRVEWPHSVELAPGLRHDIPPFDRDAMLVEVELLLDWYVPYVNDKPANEDVREEFRRLWNDAIDKLDGAQKSIVLRDYHSPNIIWRGDRLGHDRLGLIDFQDAMIGPAAYDVASLAMDARVTIDAPLEQATVRAYVEARKKAGPFDEAAFREAYAIMAAQRNSKILGIFVRLDRRDGKPAYLRHLPRIRDYVARALAHPALAGMRAFYRAQGLIDA